MRVLLLLALFWPTLAGAESLVATRLIRATEVIAPGDIARRPEPVTGAASRPDQVIGLEARVAIYPGRPVRLADLGPAAVIERNELVQMVYRRGGVIIISEGRALGRGALGDTVTVMNLGSRQSVRGIVTTYGMVEVAGSAGSMP